jgi:hypothetical protein
VLTLKKITCAISLILVLILALSITVVAETPSQPEKGKPAGNPMQTQIESLVTAGVISQVQADAVLTALTPSKEDAAPIAGQDFSQVFITKLDSLVLSGVITQVQESDIQAAIQPPSGGPLSRPNGQGDKAPGASDNSVNTNPADGIVLKIGSPKMFVKGVEEDVDPGNQTAPVTVNGTTFIPVRAVIEKLGGTVDWSAADQKATITLKNIPVVLQIGSLSATVNGSPKELNGAPFISDTGRTMLPLRFITENLGHSVNWDGSTQTITIK